MRDFRPSSLGGFAMDFSSTPERADDAAHVVSALMAMWALLSGTAAET